jgi:hypothetical protein
MIVGYNGFIAFTNYLHFREGENPDEGKMLVKLVRKKFPSEYHDAFFGPSQDENFEPTPLPVFAECDVIQHDYFLEHLDGIIKMVEESKTYDELKSKWDEFYKSIPEKYIIDIQY